MNGSIAQMIRYLGEIFLILPDHLLGRFDFQMRKIVDHTAVIFFPE